MQLAAMIVTEWPLLWVFLLCIFIHFIGDLHFEWTCISFHIVINSKEFARIMIIIVIIITTIPAKLGFIPEPLHFLPLLWHVGGGSQIRLHVRRRYKTILIILIIYPVLASSTSCPDPSLLFSTHLSAPSLGWCVEVCPTKAPSPTGIS